jgi:tripartite-type tricarboxylate transporter receptor subunit TctC
LKEKDWKRSSEKPPPNLAQLLDSDIKRWTEVIQKAGIAQQ